MNKDAYEIIKDLVENEMYSYLRENKVVCRKPMVAVNNCLSGDSTPLYDLADLTNPTQSYKNNTPFDIISGDYVLLEYQFGAIDQGYISYIK